MLIIKTTSQFYNYVLISIYGYLALFKNVLCAFVAIFRKRQSAISTCLNFEFSQFSDIGKLHDIWNFCLSISAGNCPKNRCTIILRAMYALNHVIMSSHFVVAVYGCTSDKLSHAVLFFKLLFLFPHPCNFLQTLVGR